MFLGPALTLPKSAMASMPMSRMMHGRHGASPTTFGGASPTTPISPRLAIEIGSTEFNSALDRLTNNSESESVKREEEEQDGDPTVTVQGKAHKISEVRDNNDLLDIMTDVEYRRFYDLDKWVWHRGVLFLETILYY